MIPAPIYRKKRQTDNARGSTTTGASSTSSPRQNPSEGQFGQHNGLARSSFQIQKKIGSYINEISGSITVWPEAVFQPSLDKCWLIKLHNPFYSKLAVEETTIKWNKLNVRCGDHKSTHDSTPILRHPTVISEKSLRKEGRSPPTRSEQKRGRGNRDMRTI